MAIQYLKEIQYHPPILGLSATREINATAFPALIQDSKTTSEAKALFRKLYKEARKESIETGILLYRFLYVFNPRGKIQNWVDKSIDCMLINAKVKIQVNQ